MIKTVSAQTYSSPVIIATSPWATSDLIVDPEGNLFFCGTQNSPGGFDGRIYKIKKTPTGYDPNYILIASLQGALWDLVMDQNGNLFTVEGSQGYIYKIPSTGGGNYSQPVLITTGLGASSMGLAIDKTNGNLYSIGFYAGKIYEIKNTAGVYNTTATEIATGIGSFSDITIDDAGTLYITSGFWGTLYSLPRINGVYSTVPLQIIQGLTCIYVCKLQ